MYLVRGGGVLFLFGGGGGVSSQRGWVGPDSPSHQASILPHFATHAELFCMWYGLVNRSS